MLFNSVTFVAFYVTVFAAYWLLHARRPQNLLLLGASWIFYGAWSWKFLLLLLASTVLDYVCGLLIDGAASQRRKRLVLIVSVTSNLLFLATFKYLGFFAAELAALLERVGFDASLPVLNIVLPVGISFYTFQTIGYVVDVYRGKVRAERDFFDYALYVAFFPQLVAGPIERAGHMLPQYKAPRVWSAPKFESGLQLAFWGLFKKVVIADKLAPYVDVVYGNPADFSGVALVTATVFFAFQIYCDFSGYTDTARGVARMLGFELMPNFAFPYISKSPVEFWQRWHISLSKWFQDYLYYPLAIRYMRKGGWGSKYKAHIVAMALIGIWHGANWTFLVFGLYWGCVIALYLFLQERAANAEPGGLAERIAGWTAPVRDFGSVALMFMLVSIGWVYFRAESIHDAWYVLTHVFSASGAPDVMRPEIVDTAVLWTLIAGLCCAEWLYRHSDLVRRRLEANQLAAIAGRYALLAAIVVASGASQVDGARPFIYFQF
ncbi:MAG TPA: MBOAT family O-acyltransferase [Gammaproteobacteria bacterium]|nr:MBOAT family O-acyltransferase [Gammaproteobacteria bacterium]